MGIRGGQELYELHRNDITVCLDKAGREYVKYVVVGTIPLTVTLIDSYFLLLFGVMILHIRCRFQERTSKNNSYSLKRYNKEQFRKTFHSYETDFVLTLKQYHRHMAPEVESSKPDLFM